jgi:hypothetical protein
MRSWNLLLLLLLLVVAFVWLAALRPDVPQDMTAYIKSFFHHPAKPPVTCRNLLAVMRQTYDTEVYDFICVEQWTGTVKLTIKPVR